MKQLPFQLLCLISAFLIGVFFVQLLNPTDAFAPIPITNEIIVQIDESLPVVDIELPSAEEKEFTNPLDKIWVEDDEVRYGKFKLSRECTSDEFDWVKCKLLIKHKGKVLKRFEIEHGNRWWLRFGFFDFLREGDKQLVVHTYSGGAHCCYDYAIYDLQPNFRVIYDSSKYGSGSAIGNELVPTDIDGDGVFEFHQDVMAFDYLAPGGHATSTFPPAVFAYEKKRGRYNIANRLFPNFVLEELKKNLDGNDAWVKENAKYGTHISQEELDEIAVRETFLYWTYAGKRDEAWKYFNEHYNFEFREGFRSDFKKLFTIDPTYNSIYQNNAK